MRYEFEEHPDSHRSWIVAVVGALALLFTFGTPLSYGILREPFSETFGVSAIALSGVFSVMLFTFFIGAGVVGVFATRVPARLVLLACAGATGLVSLSIFVATSMVSLGIIFAVLGLALGTVYVLVASIVPRWFREYRGTATGLIFVGNGLGLFLLPPLWHYSLSTVGVRRGFFGIMAVTAIAFALAGLTCRRPQWTESTGVAFGDVFEWVRGLAGTRTFQLIFVGIALVFGWYQLFAAYAIDLFATRGMTYASASALFGAVGGISIISRIGGGYVADIVGTRRAFLGSLTIMTLGICVLLVPSVPVLLVGVILIGIGLGGAATLYIPVLMQVYSPEMDTAIVGIFNVAAGVGAMAMPPLGTAAILYTGGFTVAIFLTIGVAGAALWLIAMGTRL